MLTNLRSSVNLADTRKGLTELQVKLKTVSGALERYFSDELDIDSEDGYPTTMYRFVGQAKFQLDSLEDRVTLAESSFSALLAAFDEKSDTQTNEFFGHLNQFLASYKVSITAPWIAVKLTRDLSIASTKRQCCRGGSQSRGGASAPSSCEEA